MTRERGSTFYVIGKGSHATGSRIATVLARAGKMPRSLHSYGQKMWKRREVAINRDSRMTVIAASRSQMTRKAHTLIVVLLAKS